MPRPPIIQTSPLGITAWAAYALGSRRVATFFHRSAFMSNAKQSADLVPVHHFAPPDVVTHSVASQTLFSPGLLLQTFRLKEEFDDMRKCRTGIRFDAAVTCRWRRRRR